MVDTNIVIFHVDPKLGTAEEFAEQLEREGVLVYDIAVQSVRMVTHLDVNRDDAQRAAEALKKVANR
jgi:threonine aldolase